MHFQDLALTEVDAVVCVSGGTGTQPPDHMGSSALWTNETQSTPPQPSAKPDIARRGGESSSRSSMTGAQVAVSAAVWLNGRRVTTTVAWCCDSREKIRDRRAARHGVFLGANYIYWLHV